MIVIKFKFYNKLFELLPKQASLVNSLVYLNLVYKHKLIRFYSMISTIWFISLTIGLNIALSIVRTFTPSTMISIKVLRLGNHSTNLRVLTREEEIFYSKFVLQLN